MTALVAAISGRNRRSVDAELHELQRKTYGYFQHETNPEAHHKADAVVLTQINNTTNA